jgi:acyl-CoA synthetase (AMP-forming)/AMP-acid ligase II
MRTPNKVAIELTSGPKRTFGELDERSNRLANALLGKGLVKGDRVAIWLTNTLEYMDSYLACAKAGLVVVQINIRHKPAEAQYQLENSGAKAIIFCDTVVQYVDELNLVGNFLTITIGKQHVKGSVAFENFLVQGANVMPQAPEDDDLLVIGYTSGTTGFPKGAELTHHSVKTLGQTNALTNRYAMASTQVFGLSLSFTAGIPAHVLTHMWVGGTTVLMDEWDTELLVESIAKHKATFTIIPSPPIVEFCALVDAAPKKVESLNAVLHSSSKAPPEHLAMLVNSLGPRLVEGWGMTENSGGLLAATRASDYINPRPDIFESTGIAAPDAIVDIIDEDGNLLPHDGEAVGQLVAHSSSLARGYWGNPEATAKSFVNGWYNTGDLGRMTPDGYIYMIDRRNDLISSGGMNVYPSEIERIILSIPGVTLCAVVAAPHERWGQTPVAFVISNDDSLSTDTIKEVCKKELADYKLPSEIRIEKQLPTNTSGKILKHELRDRLENEKKS